MVREEIREVNQIGMRCVMCGEHIDPLILEHRRKMRTPEGAAAAFGQGRKSRDELVDLHRYEAGRFRRRWRRVAETRSCLMR
jgi:hypothetical protein